MGRFDMRKISLSKKWDEDISWVKYQNQLWKANPKRVLSNKERQRFHTIREKIKKTFYYSASMAQLLPEDQQAQIFTIDDIKPFLKALFSLESDNPEKRRKRVLQLWSEILGNILRYDYMDKIIVAESKDVRDFIHETISGKGELLKAFLWLATMKE